MHLAPNSYMSIVIVMIFGYFTSISAIKKIFYKYCHDDAYLVILFIQNFTKCECNSFSWSIAAEFQFYFMGLPVIYLYSYSRVASTLFIILLIIGFFAFRIYLVLAYPNLNYNTRIYTPSYTRGDAYFIGMLLYSM
jgi:peptidoglycan/LPS O-acetylase OafA/YrhL